MFIVIVSLIDIYLYMILVEEIPWLHFVKLNHIRKLPLNEQVSAYRQHVCDIEQIRACGGKSKSTQIANEGFLQQEDLFYILQEDGSKIYVTVEKTI
jgi:hypothetical protein